jgi:hypothetical protein
VAWLKRGEKLPNTLPMPGGEDEINVPGGPLTQPRVPASLVRDALNEEKVNLELPRYFRNLVARVQEHLISCPSEGVDPIEFASSGTLSGKPLVHRSLEHAPNSVFLGRPDDFGIDRFIDSAPGRKVD